jgi:hypothetical protein
LVSKSKIPPKFGFATSQVVEQGGEGVDAFGFHGVPVFLNWVNRTFDYTPAGAIFRYVLAVRLIRHATLPYDAVEPVTG